MRYLYQILFSCLFLIVSLAAQDTTSIEVGTFNIRFFPCNQDGELMKKYDIHMRYPPEELPTDTIMLFDLLKQLDIELLGVQEIVDPPLFGAMAKRHLGNQFEFIYAPSKAWQKVGFLYDSSILQLIGEPVIYWDISLGKPDRLRPALAAYFKTIPEGFDFHAIVVHLKSSPRDVGIRMQQWNILADLMEKLPGNEFSDGDIILLGDFNNVSPAGYQEFLPTIQKINFSWTGIEDSTIFSGYWRPDWKKPELHSSSIDQVFISDDARQEYIPYSINVGGYCAQKEETITGEFPEYYQKISDHCPVFVSFRPFPDND